MVYREMVDYGHEQVTHFVDEETGLEAIVALHDTTLGPGLGGTRLLPYETGEAALRDVMRLSQAMTYKAAAADLPLGGGKAVIVADPEEKSEGLFRAYGRAVDRLGGHYVTSVDVNTGVPEIDIVSEETDHAVGTSDGLGDPSPVTSRGIFAGLRACVETVYGSPDLDGRSVVVQGVGKVGRGLVRLLVEHGAEVTVSDVNEAAVADVTSEFGIDSVDSKDVYDASCDVFAPCAVGGVVDDETIPRLDCDIVAGGANNVLEERRHAEALRREGILYAPDYVINAGGLITVAMEHQGRTMEAALDAADEIGDRVMTLIDRAGKEDMTVLAAAERYAEERIESGDEREPITTRSD